MAIWKVQPGHHSKRWFREQKQKQRRSRAEKLFKHLIFQEFSKSSIDSKFKRPSCTKNAVQSQKGLYYQLSNSVSNAAALFSPHRCRVTIFAGVLPAGHRGLRFGALPQSMFGATVTTHLSGLRVAQWGYVRPRPTAPSAAPPPWPCSAALQRPAAPQGFGGRKAATKIRGRSKREQGV